jgi:hypothetical protein
MAGSSTGVRVLAVAAQAGVLALHANRFVPNEGSERDFPRRPGELRLLGVQAVRRRFTACR